MSFFKAFVVSGDHKVLIMMGIALLVLLVFGKSLILPLLLQKLVLILKEVLQLSLGLIRIDVAKRFRVVMLVLLGDLVVGEDLVV